MNKVRTAMIDGVGIRTSLSAIEIASLPKINAELVKKNEKLEHNWNELKKWLEIQITADKSYVDFVTHCLSIQDLIEEKESILSKMQELERGEE